jgi:hypothetical protein
LAQQYIFEKSLVSIPKAIEAHSVRFQEVTLIQLADETVTKGESLKAHPIVSTALSRECVYTNGLYLKDLSVAFVFILHTNRTKTTTHSVPSPSILTLLRITIGSALYP